MQKRMTQRPTHHHNNWWRITLPHIAYNTQFTTWMSICHVPCVWVCVCAKICLYSNSFVCTKNRKQKQKTKTMNAAAAVVQWSRIWHFKPKTKLDVIFGWLGSARLSAHITVRLPAPCKPVCLCICPVSVSIMVLVGVCCMASGILHDNSFEWLFFYTTSTIFIVDSAPPRRLSPQSPYVRTTCGAEWMNLFLAFK